MRIFILKWIIDVKVRSEVTCHLYFVQFKTVDYDIVNRELKYKNLEFTELLIIPSIIESPWIYAKAFGFDMSWSEDFESCEKLFYSCMFPLQKELFSNWWYRENQLLSLFLSISLNREKWLQMI